MLNRREAISGIATSMILSGVSIAEDKHKTVNYGMKILYEDKTQKLILSWTPKDIYLVSTYVILDDIIVTNKYMTNNKYGVTEKIINHFEESLSKNEVKKFIQTVYKDVDVCSYKLELSYIRAKYKGGNVIYEADIK